MLAVRKHTDSRWILVYIEQWLKAPFKTTDGQLQVMEKGVFQGNVISPLLANLFLYYALDVWLRGIIQIIHMKDDELVHVALWQKQKKCGSHRKKTC